MSAYKYVNNSVCRGVFGIFNNVNMQNQNCKTISHLCASISPILLSVFLSLNHTHAHFLTLHHAFYLPHRSMCVTLVFSTKGQRYLRVGLAVPLFGSLSCLRAMVAEEGSISPDQVHTHTHTHGNKHQSYPSRNNFAT